MNSRVEFSLVQAFNKQGKTLLDRNRCIRYNDRKRKVKNRVRTLLIGTKIGIEAHQLQD